VKRVAASGAVRLGWCALFFDLDEHSRLLGRVHRGDLKPIGHGHTGSSGRLLRARRERRSVDVIWDFVPMPMRRRVREAVPSSRRPDARFSADRGCMAVAAASPRGRWLVVMSSVFEVTVASTASGFAPARARFHSEEDYHDRGAQGGTRLLDPGFLSPTRAIQDSTRR
jgi:hypothetical protein